MKYDSAQAHEWPSGYDSALLTEDASARVALKWALRVYSWSKANRFWPAWLRAAKNACIGHDGQYRTRGSKRRAWHLCLTFESRHSRIWRAARLHTHRGDARNP
jgi:hypothetical protein